MAVLRSTAAAFAAALAALAALAAAGDPPKLSDYFRVCGRSDPRLHDCVRDCVNEARERLVQGIPALRVPPLDPLRIERLTVGESGAGLRMEFTLLNASIDGFREYRVVGARVDPGRPSLHLDVRLPQLNFTGGYELAGNFMLLPASGQGDFSYTVQNVSAGLRMQLEEWRAGSGRKHWRVVRCDWDLQIQHAKSQFNNLFGGNEMLGKVMNELMNRNWRAAFELYKGLTGEAFGLPFKEISNAVFAHFPVDELFSD